MRERAARILAELEYVQTRTYDTLWRATFANAARAVNLTLAAGLLLNFKFHNRERRRLNSAAMRVRYPKLSVAIQNAVKFYKFIRHGGCFCLKFICGRRFISLIVSLV